MQRMQHATVQYFSELHKLRPCYAGSRYSGNLLYRRPEVSVCTSKIPLLYILDTNTTTDWTKPMESKSLIWIQSPPITSNKEKGTGEEKYRVRVE